MIVMDLDATLLNDEKNISSYNLSILEKCKNIGIKIAIATARSEKEADRVVKLLKPDFMILNGGGLVLNKKGRILYEKLLPADISDRIIAKCINNKNIGIITVDTKNGYFLNYKEPAWHPDFMNGVYNDFSVPLSQEIYKIVLELYNDEIAKEIQNEYPETSLIKFSGENWYGISHREAKKMLAIEAIAKEENILTENIIAFGDDFNDMEMIEKCGIGIAMGNAIDEIKNIAKHICGNNNDNGIGKWIEANIFR